MKATNIKTIFTFLVVLAIMGVGMELQSAEPNDGCLIELGQEAKKIVYLTESVYWPAFDYGDVTGYVSEPNTTRRDNFIKLMNQIADPNYLPEKPVEKTCFLQGWRGEAKENFVMQYEKGPYVIRVKNQTTEIVAGRIWKSYWITMVIQRKDHGLCVNKSDLNAIFDFADQFLGKKINSESQNYSDIKNMDGTKMDKPRFQKMDDGYILAYPVGASKLDICGVNIWTDGNTVIINLQETQRKVILSEDQSWQRKEIRPRSNQPTDSLPGPIPEEEDPDGMPHSTAFEEN
jgi:hypothetical protein